ncbi:MAG: undecaprenyldiphospho-muramoylpentapeptide beta-N-acetylglucosaminyltransferase [Desulfobacterales bacterium CG2_30_60_27]|nr:MAG: undecaprenyldiphospho-muramoylpentapeptide beta-N-acetylglucosaminyltransferase [Desulfobacterales bacterium CG2_30_60_27]
MRIVITGGGTGGHLFPGIAVAEALRDQFPGGEVLFVGAGRQMDARALERHRFRAATIRCQGLKGKGSLARMRAMVELPMGLVQALLLLRRFRPALVFGVGGYVTGPVLLAARLLGIPTCIHEQNSVAGLANRWLGRLVDRVFISIPGSEAFFPARKTVLTGNPVRRELLARPAEAGQRATGPTLLILGGSQGAHRVNTLVVGALSRSRRELPASIAVIHQTGRADEEMVRAAYARVGIQARVAAFFDDMALVYGAADLIVSRAGATTLAELAVLKKPALLIPYPFAADGHQEKNGCFLVAAGAARMCLEADLTEEKLARELINLLADGDLRQRMGESMGRVAQPLATENIVRECLALLGMNLPSVV